jgi:hypothetical protein
MMYAGYVCALLKITTSVPSSEPQSPRLACLLLGTKQYIAAVDMWLCRIGWWHRLRVFGMRHGAWHGGLSGIIAWLFHLSPEVIVLENRDRSDCSP